MYNSIQESSCNVDRVTFEVICSHKCKMSTHNRQADCGGEGLNKVPTRSLGETQGHQTSLVLLNGAVCSALDVEHPTRSNRSTASRELDQAPGTMYHSPCVQLFPVGKPPILLSAD